VSFIADFIIAIYTLWILATVANQFHTWCPKWLRAIDIFGLIPVWTFFAPNPGMTDYYLLYRDRMPDGSMGNWKKIVLRGSDNGLWQALWNPTKRRQKALSDLLTSSIELFRNRDIDAVAASVPYILLLNFVDSQPHALGTFCTQFMVMEHDGFGEKPERSRVLLLSKLHRVD
jgi:hypothetical protein